MTSAGVSPTTRATAVIVTTHPGFGSVCQGAFRRAAVFPVVVGDVGRAIVLLRQFRADIIIVEAPEAREEAERRMQLADVSGTTPVLFYRALPPPSELAEAVRHAIRLANRPDSPTSPLSH